MDELNLVDIQKSAKKIRNPLNVPFTWTWQRKPITIPGGGEWFTVIGRLRDHLARHLFMKIRYKYHDEMVKKLMKEGLKEEARSFHVPRDVENLIWREITDENMPEPKTGKRSLEEELENPDGELKFLHEQISKMDSTAAKNSGAFSAMQLIEQAQARAEGLSIENKDAGHISGTAAVVDTMIPEDQPIDTTPVTIDQVAQGVDGGANPLPTTPETKGESLPEQAPEEFKGLEELG